MPETATNCPCACTRQVDYLTAAVDHLTISATITQLRRDYKTVMETAGALLSIPTIPGYKTMLAELTDEARLIRLRIEGYGQRI